MAPGYRTLLYSIIVLMLAHPAGAGAQQPGSVTPAALTPVPRVVWFSGAFHPADGQAIAPVETVTLAVYDTQDGGTPLWLETQTVAVNADGRFNVLLGSTTADGLPLT